MVEFKTTFDADKVNKLNQRQLGKTKRAFTILMTIFVVLGVLMICIASEEFSESSDEAWSSLFLGVFLIVFGILYYPIVKLFAKKYQNKINKTTTLLSSQTEEIYKFDEDKLFIFTTKGDEYKSAVETNYTYINNVVETDDAYYLYVSKIQCHVINKNELISGTFEELNKIFAKHFPGDKLRKEIKLNK